MTTSHFPRSWQPRRLPLSVSATRRVMMALPPPSGIMTKPKYLPTIKEGNKVPNTTYMDLHTRRKVSLLYLVKGQLCQLIYLSNHGWQNHRRVCPDTLSGRLLQGRLNQESILVEIVRPSIWQLRGSPGCEALTIPTISLPFLDPSKLLCVILVDKSITSCLQLRVRHNLERFEVQRYETKLSSVNYIA